MRNRLILSRKNYCEQNESKDNLFDEKQKNHYNYLANKYEIEIFNNGKVSTYLENMYNLNIFDKYFSVQNKDSVDVLDIGSKNWTYAKSEYVFFNQKYNNVNLRAIELDAYRINTNFYTRYEIAKYQIKSLKNTKYIIGNFLKHDKKYDYIIWLLPFITEYPLVRWGLPLRYFNPISMLEHAYNSLNKGGELLIINQGEKEYNIQRNLNEQLNLNAEYFGKIDDIFEVFEQDRYCSKITK